MNLTVILSLLFDARELTHPPVCKEKNTATNIENIRFHCTKFIQSELVHSTLNRY